MDRPDLLIVGRIRKAQGIRGEVTVESLTDEPGAIFAPGRRLFAGTVDGDLARDPADKHNPDSVYALTVESASPFKGGYIVKFDVIPDRNTAELWRLRYLLVPHEELTPPSDDEVYIHDLLGMAVHTRNGEPLGEITAFYELPQGLTLEVGRGASSVLVPYRPGIVLEVDRDARVLTVDETCGLFG